MSQPSGHAHLEDALKDYDGNDIPLTARVLCIADVYDALTSQRSYKKAFTHDEASYPSLFSAGSPMYRSV